MRAVHALRTALVGAALTALAAASAAVEVNTASQAELERLKGIGVQLSTELLSERAKRPFTDWHDLRARVRGIGPRQAAALSQAGLTVAGHSYETPPAEASSPSSGRAK